MPKLIVEYLIMLRIKGNFCNNTDSFNKLLETNSLISIKKDKLFFNKKEFSYWNFTSEVKDKDQRYFKIKLEGQEESIIPQFLELLKIIREQTFRADGNINILWDDISNYYSTKAYPEINKIENLMRKLLTTFMLTNIGINWSNETLPTEVKSSLKLKNKKDNSNTNLLHETDFIQLADFLFKPYQTQDISNLYKQLKNCKDISELDLNNLKEFIPRSNWERYFKTFVNFENELLNKKWSKLYELRCIIAHNNFLSHFEYEETIALINELTPRIYEAIDSIDKIIVPTEEKDQVIENVVTSIDDNSKEFLSKWREVNKFIQQLYVDKIGPLDTANNISNMIVSLVEKSTLKQDFLDDIEPIGIFRDKLVKLEYKVDVNEVILMTKMLQDFYSKYYTQITFQKEKTPIIAV